MLPLFSCALPVAACLYRCPLLRGAIKEGMAGIRVGPFAVGLTAGFAPAQVPQAGGLLQPSPIPRGLRRVDIQASFYELMEPRPISLRRTPLGIRGYGVIMAREPLSGALIFEPVNPVLCDLGQPEKQVYSVSDLDGISRRRSLVICILSSSFRVLIHSRRREPRNRIVEITHAELRSGTSQRPGIAKLLQKDHLHDAIDLLNLVWPGEAGGPRLLVKPLNRMQSIQGEITSAAINDSASKGHPMESKQERDELRYAVMSSICHLEHKTDESKEAYYERAKGIGARVARGFVSRRRSPSRSRPLDKRLSLPDGSYIISLKPGETPREGTVLKPGETPREGTVHCVQINCPEGFADGVVCWKCKEIKAPDSGGGSGAPAPPMLGLSRWSRSPGRARPPWL